MQQMRSNMIILWPCEAYITFNLSWVCVMSVMFKALWPSFIVFHCLTLVEHQKWSIHCILRYLMYILCVSFFRNLHFHLCSKSIKHILILKFTMSNLTIIKLSFTVQMMCFTYLILMKNTSFGLGASGWSLKNYLKLTVTLCIWHSELQMIHIIIHNSWKYAANPKALNIN